jgi:hypothetical protein
MEKFYEIRAMKDLQKRPSTSELLDWLRALALSGVDLAKSGASGAELPFLGVLLKKNQDIDALTEYSEKGYTTVNW